MNGQNAIISLRLRGYAPSDVWVMALDAEPQYFEATHPENLLANGFLAEIDVLPTDNPATLDFRCLRGLTAHVVGENPRRVRALFNRIQQFEPAQVLAVTDELLHWKPE
jgi:hypothetical protein